MDLHIRMTGTTPYLQKNIRGVDPELPAARELKAITDKKSRMTEDDLARVARLEWHIALYTDEAGRLVVPTRNIKKCFIDAGKITRHGSDVARALSFRELSIPLIHSGNGDLDAMYDSGEFVSRLAVGIGKKRTMRIRPQFFPWSLEFQAYLFEDVMDADTFARIVERAGLTIGLGDNRVNGYGRFTAQVRPA